MAKFELKIKARKLRKRGMSVKQIAKELDVAKSTASIWVRDIILSVEQLEDLQQRSIRGAERGRLRSAFLQKERWSIKRNQATVDGRLLLQALSKRELLIAGLALYWGEGYKKGRCIEFCNSDPKMIKFFLLWINQCFNVSLNQVYCSVGINQLHEFREDLVKKYWSHASGIPLSQFNKTSFKKVNNKKIYDNINEHFGTLSVKVRSSGGLFLKIIGLIDVLSIIPEWQGSSMVEHFIHNEEAMGSSPIPATRDSSN